MTVFITMRCIDTDRYGIGVLSYRALKKLSMQQSIVEHVAELTHLRIETSISTYKLTILTQTRFYIAL